MMWKIRSKTLTDVRGKPKYWSDEFGWTWIDMSDTYSTVEKDGTPLPIGGEWEEL